MFEYDILISIAKFIQSFPTYSFYFITLATFLFTIIHLNSTHNFDIPACSATYRFVRKSAKRFVFKQGESNHYFIGVSDTALDRGIY